MDNPSRLRWTGGQHLVLDVRVVRGPGGGPERTILQSAAYLADSGYRSLATYLHSPHDPGFDGLRRRAAAAGCPLIGVPDRGPLDPTVLVRLLGICRRRGVRIWHGHDYKSNLLGLLVRPLHPMKLVTTVHGWVQHTRRTPLYYALDRRCLPHFDHVICVSDDLYAQVRELGLPTDRCSLVHNGVDVEFFTRSGPAATAPRRAALGVPAGRLVVGAVGRLSPEKGLGHLIEASASLLARGLDFEVWIAGEGPDRPELERHIRRAGLQERIRLVGFQEQVVPLYEALDALALSSLREGLPNVLLEAMAMGVPVVATSVGGISRLVREGQTGLLCRAGDSQSLGAALARLLTDPGLRANLAAAGQVLVRREFSFSQRMAKMLSIYDHLLVSNGRAQPRRPPDRVSSR